MNETSHTDNGNNVSIYLMNLNQHVTESRVWAMCAVPALILSTFFAVIGSADAALDTLILAAPFAILSATSTALAVRARVRVVRSTAQR